MGVNPTMGVMLVLGAAALWGTTGTAQALAGGSMPAVWFGALRLLVASAFFLLVVLLPGRRDGPRGRPTLAVVLGAGLCMAIYNLAFFAGIGTTGVALGTAITLGSGPLWAALLQSVLQRRTPPIGWWCGMALGVTGGVAMSGALGGSAVALDAVGVLLCLSAGLAYAVYTLLNKRVAASVPAATFTCAAFSVAAALSLPAAWLQTGLPAATAADVLAVLYTGVVTAGVAYLLFSLALRHISSATSVTLALGEPVVAFVLAAMVLGEPVSAAGVLGLVLIVAGVLIVIRQELRAGDAQGRRAAQGEGRQPVK